MPSKPKRHHQVPRKYLERFAANGNVLVRRRDGLAFRASPVNVAVESGFYYVVDDKGADSTEVEEFLATVEGAAHRAFSVIDATLADPDCSTSLVP